MYFHDIKSSELSWTNKSTLATYSATPGFLRYFCRNCGSFLAWGADPDQGDLEFTVGTVDEKWLITERDESGKPKGGFGLDLADPNSTWFWSLNEIKGVTDDRPGVKFSKGTPDGPMNCE